MGQSKIEEKDGRHVNIKERKKQDSVSKVSIKVVNSF